MQLHQGADDLFDLDHLCDLSHLVRKPCRMIGWTSAGFEVGYWKMMTTRTRMSGRMLGVCEVPQMPQMQIVSHLYLKNSLMSRWTLQRIPHLTGLIAHHPRYWMQVHSRQSHCLCWIHVLRRPFTPAIISFTGASFVIAV